MRSNLYKIVIIIFLFFLAACGPSEKALQEAAAQTQTAQPTSTHTPEPTATRTLEPTITPTITQTPTPTPEPIVITLPPEDLMLMAEDLPSDAAYMLNTMGGFPYQFDPGLLEESEGRLDGWMTYFIRGDDTVRAPAAISCSIIQHETQEQALNELYYYYQKYLTEYEGGFAMYHGKSDLGDDAIAFKIKIYPSSEMLEFGFQMFVVYRNYMFSVTGMGLEDEFDLEYVKQIAQIALEKLEAAPLGYW